MNDTQNVQNQSSSTLQQPQSNLQGGQSAVTPGTVPGQTELVAPQLHVGNSSVGVSGRNASDPSQSQVSPHSGLPLLLLIVPVILVTALFWPTKKVESVLPEPEPVVSPKSTPKKKSKAKSGKRKKSKR